MLNDLLHLPHPSWTELIISTQLVIWGLLIKEAIHLSITEEEKLRKQYIQYHVRHHSGRFIRCDVCIIKTDQGKLSQMDLETVVLPELPLDL